MSRRRLRQRAEKVRRHAPPPAGADPQREIIREATRVERLAYTRTQAAEALGISRSTFNRRVLPYVETLDMPWGTKLIPVDELKRLLAERRRSARSRRQPTTPRPSAGASTRTSRPHPGRAGRWQEPRPDRP
jgi:Bacterial regulatory protein, Fis family